MASRICKTCGLERTRNRVCDSCASKKTCEICGIEHGRGAQAKFCETCKVKAYYEPHNQKLKALRRENPKLAWDSPSYMGLEPSQMDWARLAAYIDGEGYIGITASKAREERFTDRIAGRICVTNTDIRLGKWCLETFGMRLHDKAIVPGKRKGREDYWKRCFYAAAQSYRATWICRNCLPYFLLKAEQAKILIEMQKSVTTNVFERGKGLKVPQDILEYRLSLKSQIHDLNRRGTSEYTNEKEIQLIAVSS